MKRLIKKLLTRADRICAGDVFPRILYSKAELSAMRDAYTDCISELRAHFRWHPMTDEPEGEDGVNVCLDVQNQRSCLDYVDGEWVDTDNVREDSDEPFRAPWPWWADRYPNAVWTYLPERGQR